MKILVLVGVYGGVAEEVKVFKEEDRDKMLEEKKKLMADYEIEEGHEEDAEHHVEVFEKEI